MHNRAGRDGDSVSQATLKIVRPFPWMRVIRRLDLPKAHRAVKLVGYTIGTYANVNDGDNAFPGEKRLMADCLLSERSVRDSLKWLRDNYLIYRRERGSSVGRTNYADRYQLIVASDWRTRYPLLDEPNDDGKWEPWHVPKSS